MIFVYTCPSCKARSQTTHCDVFICCGEQMILTETYRDLEEYKRVKELFF